MIFVNTHEAKIKLSSLLLKIENEHEKVTICRNGKPIAELVPFKFIRNPLKQSQRLSTVQFNENPVLPLNEDDWPDAFK